MVFRQLNYTVKALTGQPFSGYPVFFFLLGLSATAPFCLLIFNFGALELFGLSLRALLHPEDEVFRAVSLALGFVMAQLPNGFKINALDAVTVL